MKQNPFHFSFFVKDLDSTRKFYGEILACKEGRSTDTWVDFDFFGNQISAHIHNELPAAINCGKVDNISVPIPHFGSILPWEDFQRLAERLKNANVQFVIEPRIRFEGQPAEQATMFLKDFSGNAIEFKSFKHPGNVFTA
ncbi:MAG: VOC family protein [Ignavibacteria bacterium]